MVRRLAARLERFSDALCHFRGIVTLQFSWQIPDLGGSTVKDELDSEAINRKLTDALQKILQCGDAGGGTRDSRLATIRHIARTTLDTLSKEKAAGEPAAAVHG